MAEATTYPPVAVQAAKTTMTKYGITSPYMQAAILATMAKESGFKPRNEASYSKTNNARIRTIFGSRVPADDAALNKLKANDQDFFNTVYGGQFGIRQLGNTQPGDGYKYRGRGLNGITGRSLYTNIGKRLGVDLIANPDKLNDVEIAAEAGALYFVDAFAAAKKTGLLKKKIGVNDISEINDLQTATKAAVQANAGFGTDLTGEFLQENLNKAKATVDYFFSTLGQVMVNPVAAFVKRPWTGIGMAVSIFSLGIGLFLILHKR